MRITACMGTAVSVVIAVSCTATNDTACYVGTWTDPNDDGPPFYGGPLTLTEAMDGGPVVGSTSAGLDSVSVELVTDTLDNVILTNQAGALLCAGCSASAETLTCSGILSRAVCSFTRLGSPPSGCADTITCDDGAPCDAGSTCEAAGCNPSDATVRDATVRDASRRDASQHEASSHDAKRSEVGVRDVRVRDVGQSEPLEDRTCGTSGASGGTFKYSVSPVGGEGQVCEVSCTGGDISSIVVTYGSNCHPTLCPEAGSGCVGSSQCSVKVDNVICGSDPCPNVAKGATIVVACGPG